MSVLVLANLAVLAFSLLSLFCAARAAVVSRRAVDRAAETARLARENATAVRAAVREEFQRRHDNRIAQFAEAPRVTPISEMPKADFDALVGMKTSAPPPYWPPGLDRFRLSD